MLSLCQVRAAIIACWAGPADLDALAAVAPAHPCRVAQDELLLLAPLPLAIETRRIAERCLERAEGGALVLDQTDGWSIRALAGPETMRALAQLSAIRFPDRRPAFVQGVVADVPAKVLLLARATYVLVPRTVGHHLDARLGQVAGCPEPSQTVDLAPPAAVLVAD